MNISTFKAFHSRNYRLYFFGQFVSLIGTWMQRTAVYWIVYIQTHSAFMLGLTVFSTQFPSFLLSLFGGVVADRYDRYKLLLLTQIASMIQAILLALAVLFTHYTITEILVLSIILGVINAFDIPARQSLVYYMVDDKEDLSNAIALNSSMVNLARLIGPTISGVVLYKLGAGVCFMLNALSFTAVIISLLMMNLADFLPQMNTKKIFEELKDGFNYLQSTPSIGIIILLLSFISLLVLPYMALFPIIAKEILKGNASTYGYLNSFTGIGALIAAIFLASAKKQMDLRKVLVIATVILGIGLILFSYTYSLIFAFIFSTITGFGMMLHVTIINTLLQTTSSIEMRGRVISYYAMAFFGMQPLGALLIGSISHYIGASTTIFLQGFTAIIIILLFSPYLWNVVD